MKALASVVLVLAICALVLKLATAPLYAVYDADECRRAYARAHTHADSAAVDLRPLKRGAVRASGGRCGVVRAAQPLTTTNMRAIEAGARARPADVAVDHVILGIDTLAHGIALLERATGVKPIYGGAHPGRGTQNALLALGDHRYLELLAPNPSDSGRAAAAWLDTVRRLTPVGWAMRVRNADSARALFRSRKLSPSEPRAGSRARPDGRMLRWRSFDPFGVRLGLLPFAIEWDSASAHPSSDAPDGCTLHELRLVTPHADSIAGLLRRVGLDVRVAAGARDAIQLTLDCPRGRVSFP